MRAFPELCFNKASGMYYVRLNGKTRYFYKDKYLSQLDYYKMMLDIDKTSKNKDISLITVKKAIKEYMEHNIDIEELKKSGKLYDYDAVLKIAVTILGGMNIEEIKVVDIENIIHKLIKKDLSLATVNKRIRCLKQFFKYCYLKEWINSDTYYRIKEVSNIKRKQGLCKPAKVIRAVDVGIVEKTLPFLPVVVADMVKVQLLAGMRAGEVCSMRKEDIDKSGEVWIYTPEHHKTENKGKSRRVFLGPKVKEILSKYIDEDEYLFSPQRSEKSRKETMRENRKTKVQPSQLDRSKEGAKKPKDRYNKDSYGRAIKRACNKAIKAGVLLPTEIWHNHQLRHTAGTEARKIAGLDGAQVYLGHSNAVVTEIYAERDDKLGIEIAKKIG